MVNFRLFLWHQLTPTNLASYLRRENKAQEHGAEQRTEPSSAKLPTPEVSLSTMESDGSRVHSLTPHKSQEPTAQCSSKISKLAAIISTETGKVEKYFQENGLPLPSFEAETFNDFHTLPPPIAKSRSEVIQATQELKDLMMGPGESVRWMAWDVSPDHLNLSSFELLREEWLKYIFTLSILYMIETTN